MRKWKCATLAGTDLHEGQLYGVKRGKSNPSFVPRRPNDTGHKENSLSTHTLPQTHAELKTKLN